MRYDFLVDTYRTERLKVLSVWSMFHDTDLAFRPQPASNPDDARGRSVREQMVHQCMSENMWFKAMLGIDVSAPPLPSDESRQAFIKRYAEDSQKRLDVLASNVDDSWWEGTADFFGQPRTRAWIFVRRIAHTSHHRGQQMAMLRMLGRAVHSNYGPTADTGGLPANGAQVIYGYPDEEAILAGGPKAPLVAVGEKPVTERP